MESENQNKELRDEKQRLVGVNKILEKKVQIEKSEKMTLASEVGNFGRLLGDTSKISEKASFRLAGLASGKMSTYIR